MLSRICSYWLIFLFVTKPFSSSHLYNKTKPSSLASFLIKLRRQVFLYCLFFGDRLDSDFDLNRLWQHQNGFGTNHPQKR